MDRNIKQQLEKIIMNETTTHNQMNKLAYRIFHAKKFGFSIPTDKFHLPSGIYFQNEQKIVVTIDYQHDGSGYTAPHSHDFFEMFYVYQGSCFSTINDEDCEFKQGSLCIYNLQAKHSITIPTQNDIIFNILIHPSLMQKTFFTMLSDNNNLTRFFIESIQNGDMESSYLIFDCSQNKSIQFYLQNMIVEYFTGKDSQQTQKYLQILLLGLLTMLSVEYQRSFQEDQQTDMIKTKILEYINTYYQYATLSSMAEYFHYSKRNMIYYIYKHTGKKFSELQKETRINAIKNFLTTTTLPIKEIADKVGYSFNFATTVFKQETGMTMSQYRKKNKK
ncbi:AraC family transcriptional regulator [Massilioclostridium coli]|uniref:AraC family transcriptional regulator n=1 Tax=Massilioclostridium coli TaxID=1870991 RepID=UPI00085C7E9F|nr:helix-turn-helix domain-containing protein [Massilioclostridium coli]